LNLTDAQVAELQKYNTAYQQRYGDLTRQYPTSREAAVKGYQEIYPQVGQRINQVLTEQQRQQWSGMTGDAYRFEPFYGYGAPQKAP